MNIKYTTIREKCYPAEGEEDYDANEVTSPRNLVVMTKGCSCCSEPKALTSEILEQAIKDAQEWLTYLKELHYGK